ncbi:dTDP-4-dehydrorhamnose reductase [Leptolyngbya sp. AN02str]|uniref:dTDP-4-dehydrorhamnose reductase n=1 Tax=Leptolyngbya sp. AN02str TaxID=3423363 RepID=UPI003D32316A
MSRILITGAQGQVGAELQRSLASLGDVIAAGRDRVDLSQPEQLRATLRELQPNLIVNAAAYTAVDKAETDVSVANVVNGTAPTILAEEACALGASLIHISTDYVFDGQKNTPYLEDDQPNPTGSYAKSKWLGEVGIQQVFKHAQADSLPPFFIMRTAWVYGTQGPGNFVKTMLRLGAEREELRVVADQVGSPTWAKDLADAIAVFSSRCLPGSTEIAPGSGIYHYTNSGVTSWYDFAIAIFEEARSLGVPMKVQRVLPITTAEYPTPAKRPAYSVLSGKKVAMVLGEHAPHWRQSLRQMLTEFYAHNL